MGLYRLAVPAETSRGATIGRSQPEGASQWCSSCSNPMPVIPSGLFSAQHLALALALAQCAGTVLYCTVLYAGSHHFSALPSPIQADYTAAISHLGLAGRVYASCHQPTTLHTTP